MLIHDAILLMATVATFTKASSFLFSFEDNLGSHPSDAGHDN